MEEKELQRPESIWKFARQPCRDYLKGICTKSPCDYWHTEPPESLSILRKSTKVLGSIRRVRFTKATKRHAGIRENKGPSLIKNTSQSSSSAQSVPFKFEDRSKEETERQQRCARGVAWRLAKNILKLKEKGQSYIFHLPMSGVCRPFPQ